MKSFGGRRSILCIFRSELFVGNGRKPVKQLTRVAEDCLGHVDCVPRTNIKLHPKP